MFFVPLGVLTAANHRGAFCVFSDREPPCFGSRRDFSSEIRLWCPTSVRCGTPRTVTCVFFHASWPGLCWPKFKPYYNVFLGGPWDRAVPKLTSLIQRGYPMGRCAFMCVGNTVFFPLKNSHMCHVYLCISYAMKCTVYKYVPCPCVTIELDVCKHMYIRGDITVYPWK